MQRNLALQGPIVVLAVNVGFGLFLGFNSTRACKQSNDLRLATQYAVPLFVLVFLVQATSQARISKIDSTEHQERNPSVASSRFFSKEFSGNLSHAANLGILQVPDGSLQKRVGLVSRNPGAKPEGANHEGPPILEFSQSQEASDLSWGPLVFTRQCPKLSAGLGGWTSELHELRPKLAAGGFGIADVTNQSSRKFQSELTRFGG